MVHHQLTKDQRSLKDFFKNKNHDDDPDDDGAVPGGSGHNGVITRSQASLNSDDLLNSSHPISITTKKSGNVKRLQKNKSKRKTSLFPRSKSTATASVTLGSPVGQDRLGAKTGSPTPGEPVGDGGEPAPGTGGDTTTGEVPVWPSTCVRAENDSLTHQETQLNADPMSEPNNEQVRALVSIENEYLKQVNGELKAENIKQKKKIKDMQNIIDDLRKTSSKTRQMLKNPVPKNKPEPPPTTENPEPMTQPTVAENPEPPTRPIPKPRQSKTTWKKADINISVGSRSNIHCEAPTVPQSKPKVMTVGSSLARGTSDALRRQGVDSIECSFSGAQLPYIRTQMKTKLQDNPQVDTVILVGGGNDCEAKHHIEDIKYEYDALVDEIKLTHGADTKVIISSVPQRKRASRYTHIKIAELNQHNATFYAGTEYGVTYVDAAPKFGHQFIDRVHLNYHGLEHWANQISTTISSMSGQSI